MVRCTTGRNPLDYLNYGCYCGLGGKGKILDAVDRYLHKTLGQYNSQVNQRTDTVLFYSAIYSRLARGGNEIFKTYIKTF